MTYIEATEHADTCVAIVFFNYLYDEEGTNHCVWQTLKADGPLARVLEVVCNDVSNRVSHVESLHSISDCIVGIAHFGYRVWSVTIRIRFD